MTMEYDTAVGRLLTGYYNADGISAANPGGFGNNGHEVNLPEVAEAIGVVGQQLAALSGIGAISTTNVAVAVGDATFGFAGSWSPFVDSIVVARRAGDATTYLIGPVTASAAGSVTIDAQLVAGAGSYADWILSAVTGDGSFQLLDDPAPQLGADLECNGKSITALLSLVMTGALTVGGAATIGGAAAIAGLASLAAGADVTGLLTLRDGMQSRGLWLGDVSGDVVIEAADPLDIYCTVIGDTVIQIAGGTEPGCGHQHLVHYTIGGSGGYTVDVEALAQNKYTRDLQSTAEAGETRPWTDSNTSLSSSGTGADGRTLTKVKEDATTTAHQRLATVAGLSPAQTLTVVAEVQDDGDARGVWLSIQDADATANYVDVVVDPSDGSIVAAAANHGNGSGAICTVTALDGGGYLVALTGHPNTAGSNALVAFGLTTAAGATSYAGDGASGALVGDVDIYPGTFSGVQTVGASGVGVVQGTAIDFASLTAGEVGDLGITIEPDGRIVIQDHTVETL